MDRFEEEIHVRYPRIYFDLHSSMDRFEACNAIIKSSSFLIYIPVWIDLKAVVDNVYCYFFLIYIPVWIDLKNYSFYYK